MSAKPKSVKAKLKGNHTVCINVWKQEMKYLNAWKRPWKGGWDNVPKNLEVKSDV
jgi:hypothetical protein